MSIFSALTPFERRFLASALSKRNVKQNFEESEGLEQEQHETSQQRKEREVYFCSNEQTHLPLLARKEYRAKQPDAVGRFLSYIRCENESWDLVERCLEYPFVYRSDKNRALCIKMLRRIPHLQSLQESDLEGVASHMEIVRLRAKTVVIGKSPFSCVDCFSKSDSAMSVCLGESGGSIDLPHTISQELENVVDTRTRGMSGTLNGDRYVYVVLRGNVALRMPSIQSSMRAFIEPYEIFGLPLVMNALPEGSFYETTGDCMLLRLQRDIDFLLDRVINDIEKNILEERVNFLRRQLRVKVFNYWSPDEYKAFARLLVPLQVSWRQVVVAQGMESDAMYFIKEGNCVVVRNVPFFLHQKQQKKISSLLPLSLKSPQQHSLSKLSNAGLKKFSHLEGSSQSQLLSPTPISSAPMKLVELVTLREGEFFGELGLLNHDVDCKPNVDAIRSEEYWLDKLNTALCTAVDYTALKDDLPWLSARNSQTDCDTKSRDCVAGKQGDGVFPSTSLPRQATVYTKCPCVLYMLTHDHCRSFFGEREYAQLKEFAKGYPSCENIENQYERQRKWARYCQTLVNDIFMGARNSGKRKEKLTDLHYF